MFQQNATNQYARKGISNECKNWDIFKNRLGMDLKRQCIRIFKFHNTNIWISYALICWVPFRSNEMLFNYQSKSGNYHTVLNSKTTALIIFCYIQTILVFVTLFHIPNCWYSVDLFFAYTDLNVIFQNAWSFSSTRGMVSWL